MKSILYFSLVDWFWIKQRPHHIPEILSKNNRVVYLCFSSWRGAKHLVNSHLSEQKYFKRSHFKVNKNLIVIRKKILPPKNMELLNIAYKPAKSFLDRHIKRYIKKLDSINKFDILILTSPNQISFFTDDLLSGKFIIYDCMDDYKEFGGTHTEEFVANESRLINVSKRIIVSSEELYKKLLRYGSDIANKIMVINNAVDIRSFDYRREFEDIHIGYLNYTEKKVVYIGTVAKWVDLELILHMALKHKDIKFYIIGPIDKEIDLRKYQGVKNMVFVGVQPYEFIPAILKRVDVSIMPFKKIELVKSVNPVKIYESLAMGKPVIATRYEETEKFGDLIFTYETEDEFERILIDLVNKKESESIINKRIEFAKENSWDRRVEEIEKLWKDF